jgi:nucleoside-diphosphate-sugar epimerase
LRVAAGDVTVPSTVRSAITGHDAVIQAVGGHDRFRDRRRSSRGVCSLGTAHVLDAMRDSGARRLVCLGASQRCGVGSGERGDPRSPRSEPPSRWATLISGDSRVFACVAGDSGSDHAG